MTPETTAGAQFKPDKCEWNPYAAMAAIRDGDQHIGCQSDATICVGADGKWHLCESCSLLPRFKRYKKTPLRRPNDHT